MAKKSPTFDFEASMKELEALVARMESGDLPLEETLKEFERGMELTQTCQTSLNEAQLKVETVTAKFAKNTDNDK